MTRNSVEPQILQIEECFMVYDYDFAGSRRTFEFLSRVNLSGPSLYCIARTYLSVFYVVIANSFTQTY